MGIECPRNCPVFIECSAAQLLLQAESLAASQATDERFVDPERLVELPESFLLFSDLIDLNEVTGEFTILGENEDHNSALHEVETALSSMEEERRNCDGPKKRAVPYLKSKMLGFLSRKQVDEELDLPDPREFTCRETVVPQIWQQTSMNPLVLPAVLAVRTFEFTRPKYKRRYY